MTPEVLQVSQVPLEVYLAVPLLGFAFSHRVRQIIHERDGEKSVWSGEKDNLECAHISHKKGGGYNTPENGRLLTRKEHYVDHFNRHGSDELGLENHKNTWSLWAIWKRLTQPERDDLYEPEEAGKKYIKIRRKHGDE